VQDTRATTSNGMKRRAGFKLSIFISVEIRSKLSEERGT
jgi:hypothetical protein